MVVLVAEDLDVIRPGCGSGALRSAAVLLGCEKINSLRRGSESICAAALR